MTSYRIRGLDGREYGPVDFDTLARWAREGRVVPTMEIQLDGVGPWTPAQDVPALAPLFRPAPPPGSAPPAGTPAPGVSGTPPSGAEFGPRSFVASDNPATPLRPAAAADLTVGSIFGKAFELFDWLLLGQFLVVSILITASAGILAGPLLVGFTRCCLRKVDGKPFEFGDVFKGFDNFGHALLAYVLFAVVTSAGWSCCLIPGLFMTVKWWFWSSVLAEKPGRNAIDALTDSWYLTEGRFFDLLGLGLVGGLVSIAGLCLCVVGVYPAAVVVALASAVTFRQLVPATPEASRA
jgi:hypothetical protein